MSCTYIYLKDTDEVEKQVTQVTAVKTPFSQYENELATLIAQRDALQSRIDELESVVKLKA